MKKLFLLTATITLVATPVLAREAVAKSMVAPHTCSMKNTIRITVQYNFKESSLASAKKKFDEQNAKIKAFAVKQELGKFEMQSQSYNINSQPVRYNPDGSAAGFTYSVSGSSSYNMDNEAAAFKFAEFLTAQNIRVGVNSSSYRQGSCHR